MSASVKDYKPITLPGGIYAPIPTPFTKDEEIDITSLKHHALRLARANVGLVVSGSTGEAIALSNEERSLVIHEIRSELLKNGLNSTPIIAGTGTGSLRDTIALSKEAKAAGADAVIVIAPGYFSSLLAKDRKALKEFFWETAGASPLPVMIYNFPGAASGIDLDSDLLEEIAAHPNICGAKLTCASVGKGGRLAKSTHVKDKEVFHVFPGFGDILFPCMMIGLTGTISGTANLLPRLFNSHYNNIVQFRQSPSKELLAKIEEEQDFISRADWAMSKSGIVATKWVLEKWYYPMGPPRRPLQKIAAETEKLLDRELANALQAERKLEEQAGSH